MPEFVVATDRELRPRIERLAVFGAYSDSDLYQRNRTLIEALSAHSNDTLILRPRTRQQRHSFAASLSMAARLRSLLSDGFALLGRTRGLSGRDTIFTPYPAYIAVTVLWLTGRLRNRRLIVDAFLDLYSTVVDDRALLRAGSLRARLLLYLQRLLLCRADLLFIDTSEHARLLRTRLGSSAPPIVPVPVGIDELQWSALEPAPVGERCRLLFWGTFIPLHGIGTIIEALRLLEQRSVPVDCLLLGDGQVADMIAAELESSPLESLTWERRFFDTDALRRAVADAHIVLGIFAASEKASSVVPYKVHQGLASNRAVISRASAAVDSQADAENGFVTVAPEDPQELASAVEALWLRLRSGWTPATRPVFTRYFGKTAVDAAIRTALEGLEPSS